MHEVVSSTKRRKMASMMSPTSSMWDSTHRLAISGKKSSYEAEVGRHGKSCCTELGAFLARTRLIVATRASGGGISSRVEGTNSEDAKNRMSYGNGGIHGSPYASQRAIQILWGKIAIRRGEKYSLLILWYIK